MKHEADIKKMMVEAGTDVWVIDRNECGLPCDVTGFVFLAAAAGKVIVSASINGSSDIDYILDKAVEETACDYTSCSLAVYPQNDCYLDKAAAEAAFEAEVQGMQKDKKAVPEVVIVLENGGAVGYSNNEDIIVTILDADNKTADNEEVVKESLKVLDADVQCGSLTPCPIAAGRSEENSWYV